MRLFPFSILVSAAIALAMALQGCLQGGEGRPCGVMQEVKFEKVLTPTDRNFELSTPAVEEDYYRSAITGKGCSVHFQLVVGFEKDTLQAKARPAQAYNLPLTGLTKKNPTLFFMNDSVTVFDGWHTYLPPNDLFYRDSTRYYLSTVAETKGDSDRGTFSIRTSLSSWVSSADSNVWVRARIRYQTGSYDSY